MGLELDLSRLPLAQGRLEDVGLDIMRGSAEEGKRVARSRARYDQGEMYDGIDVVETPDGADLVATDEKSIWHEFGTGVYAGDADPKYPDQRGSTGSEAEEIPWVYMGANGFVTTYGVTPAPMVRPGFVAGREFFEAEKKRHGL